MGFHMDSITPINSTAGVSGAQGAGDQRGGRPTARFRRKRKVEAPTTASGDATDSAGEQRPGDGESHLDVQA